MLWTKTRKRILNRELLILVVLSSLGIVNKLYLNQKT